MPQSPARSNSRHGGHVAESPINCLRCASMASGVHPRRRPSAGCGAEGETRPPTAAHPSVALACPRSSERRVSRAAQRDQPDGRSGSLSGAGAPPATLRWQANAKARGGPRESLRPGQAQFESSIHARGASPSGRRHVSTHVKPLPTSQSRNSRHGKAREPTWTDRIREDLRRFLAGRVEWPTYRELERGGRRGLRDAITRFGGAERWAKELRRALRQAPSRLRDDLDGGTDPPGPAQVSEGQEAVAVAAARMHAISVGFDDSLRERHAASSGSPYWPRQARQAGVGERSGTKQSPTRNGH